MRKRARMLQSAQLALGWILGAIAVATCCVALVGWLRPPLSRLWLDRTVLGGAGVALLAALVGAIAGITGPGPEDPLHLVYAGLAVLVLPIGRAWGDEPRPGPMLLAGVALIGITLRLFQTG